VSPEHADLGDLLSSTVEAANKLAKRFAEVLLLNDELGRELAKVTGCAHRADDVAAWIKEHRDRYLNGAERTGAWYAIDDLLDDYREHADTGTPLNERVQGPHPEEI
jgi:predicted TIM-barrel fold metal-dependent hydrolase